ncbi:hypothetical protein JVT61DRAFT_9510 [Boletus reticuloceps]|uniref:Uncharacterized protein n=1 Tax=Boletus reticuloceps TaxID=495285 RepID=A0A8I3A5V9_9AGAM|nr:hypothetical protein JVT61DRAFT_9510 [Boletus reticuloceps]
MARAAGGSSTESSQQQDGADGKAARQSPPLKRTKHIADKGFPVGPPKRKTVVVQTGARHKQDAVVITTHKKGGPHVIPTAQSSMGTTTPTTSSAAVEEPEVPVTQQEFNRLQEQLQQLNMLHIGVGQRVQSLGEVVQAQSEAMQTFGRILENLRQGEVSQGSTLASAQLRYPFQAINTASVPSTPPRLAENELSLSSPTPRAGIATTGGSPHAQSRWLVLSSPPPCRNASLKRASTPSQARPSPWLSPMQISSTPPAEPRAATTPAEELPAVGLQTSADVEGEATDNGEPLASGMQGLLDYHGDSEDESMEAVTAEAE